MTLTKIKNYVRILLLKLASYCTSSSGPVGAASRAISLLRVNFHILQCIFYITFFQFYVCIFVIFPSIAFFLMFLINVGRRCRKPADGILLVFMAFLPARLPRSYDT